MTTLRQELLQKKLRKDFENIIIKNINIIKNESVNDDFCYDLTDSFYGVIKEQIRPYIFKEKDRLIFDLTYANHMRKKLFFDIDYRFNDSVAKTVDVLVEFVNILNE